MRQVDCLSQSRCLSVFLDDPFLLTSTVELYFYDMFVDSSRQVDLYDLNTIVAAVGGSLGLFLGFSCMQFVSLLFNWGSKISRLGYS